MLSSKVKQFIDTHAACAVALARPNATFVADGQILSIMVFLMYMLLYTQIWDEMS